MSIVNFRKVKCDNCGKEETIEGGCNLPFGWLEVQITEWQGNSGRTRFDKEVCNDKCALELIHKLKKIPPKPPAKIY